MRLMHLLGKFTQVVVLLTFSGAFRPALAQLLREVSPNEQACELLQRGGLTFSICRVRVASRQPQLPVEPKTFVLRSSSSVEDFVWYQSPPPSTRLIYQITSNAEFRLAVSHGGILVEDSAGRPRMRIERPWIRDASGTTYNVDLRESCDSELGFRCRLTLDWSSLSLRYPILVDPEWKVVDTRMCSARQFHTATLLGSASMFSGRVLITGGLDSYGQPTNLVELFDPDNGTITQCASMVEPRAYHTATWVSGGSAGGQVLIVGGYKDCGSTSCEPGDTMQASRTYELYDPDVDCNTDPNCTADCSCDGATHNAAFLPASLARAEHTATLLGSDLDSGAHMVLIAGGTTDPQVLLFDPMVPSNPWKDNAMTVPPRFGHTATFISPTPGTDSQYAVVFVAGGSSEPLSAASPVSEDLVLSPFGGAVVRIEHDLDAGLTESRPARTHSAALFGGTHVLLWGGSDTTNPVDVDFSSVFRSGDTRPSWTPFVPPTAVAATKFAANLDATAIPSLRGTLFVGGLERGSCKSSGSSPYYDGSNRWNPLVANLNYTRTNHTLTAILKDKSLTAIVIGGSSQKGSGVCLQDVQDTIEILKVADQGQPCTQASDCLTNHCSDSICCDQDCPHQAGSGTECQACNSDGLCKPVEVSKPCTAAGACVATTCDGKLIKCPMPTVDQCSAPDNSSGGTGGAGTSPGSTATGGVSPAPTAGGSSNTVPSSGGFGVGGAGGAGGTTLSAPITGGTTLGTIVTSSTKPGGERDGFMSCAIGSGAQTSRSLAWLALSLTLVCRRRQQAKATWRHS